MQNFKSASHVVGVTLKPESQGKNIGSSPNQILASSGNHLTVHKKIEARRSSNQVSNVLQNRSSSRQGQEKVLSQISPIQDRSSGQGSIGRDSINFFLPEQQKTKNGF